MTQDTKHAPRRAATCPGPRAGIPAAALVALLLAGCSSGHIGDSWQCPLAEGGSCDSVAAADPAVPDAGGRTVLGEPLWQVRGSAPETRSKTVCETGCGGGFDPFGWLARLFGDPGSGARPGLEPQAGAGGNDGVEERSVSGQSGPATATTTGALPASPVRAADAAAISAAPEAAGPEAAVLPAEPASAAVGPQADDLRTGEVVARIWIAPFVDADGVYREASHIRVVLEPAGWRLK